MKNFKILLMLFLSLELINSKLSAMVGIQQNDKQLVAIFTEKFKSFERCADSQAFPLEVIKSMVSHIKSAIGDPEKIIQMRQILSEANSNDVELMLADDALLKLLKEIKVIESIHMIDLSDLECKQRVKKIIILALWDYTYYVYNRFNK